MNIAVLLTCHNRRAKTENCLVSLGRALDAFNGSHNENERVTLEIYLVDDGCTDETTKAAHDTVEYAPLHILKGDGNLYWAGGMRYCWREAMKRHHEWNYYLLINDDTEMMKNLFDELFYAQSYSRNQFGQEGIVSGITCAMDDATKLTYGGDVIINRFLSTKRRLSPNGKPQLCDQTNANILLVPKSIVDCIGIFYDGYTHGFADSDYSRMARRKDIPIVLTANFCGRCEQDHGTETELAHKLIGMSLKQRRAYFRNPLHSNKEYFRYIRRNSPIRLPLVWLGRMMNLYLPKLYYRINRIR